MNLPKQNILIVEDEPETLEILLSIFRKKFSNVFTATDGYKALEIFEKNKIDAILCDINIPKLNGIETITKIRKIDYSIPIIVISAYSDTDTLLKASNCNIQGYILKPMKFEDIENIMQKISQHQNNEYIHKNINLNSSLSFSIENSELTLGDEIIKLTIKESEFLNLLIKKRGFVVPYSIIEQVVWSDDVMSNTSLRTLVKNIRKKLTHNIIENVPKLGYRITI